MVVQSLRVQTQSMCRFHHGHPLVHEGKEADGRSGNAHGVDEAAGEVRAKDGAEVVLRDLLQ